MPSGRFHRRRHSIQPPKVCVAPPPPPGVVVTLDVTPPRQSALPGDIVIWSVLASHDGLPECDPVSLSVTNLTFVDPDPRPCNHFPTDVDTFVPDEPGTYNCWWRAEFSDGTIALRLTVVDVESPP